MPAEKAPKWYPADDIKPKAPSGREAASRGIAKLKKSIKPGSVLILLGGRFRGKRVVFLKQLPSGLLLVTGPYQLNGVPLRRVNQAYCIGTSASVDIKGVDVSKVDDAFFARTKKPKAKKDDEFFAGEDEVRTSARPLPRPTRGPRRDTREQQQAAAAVLGRAAFWLLPAAWKQGVWPGRWGVDGQQHRAVDASLRCVAGIGGGRRKHAARASCRALGLSPPPPCSRLRRSRS